MDRFHQIALEEFVYAMQEGKHEDSNYVKMRAYERYERELQEGNKDA